MKTILYKNIKAFTLCAGFFSLVAVACKEKSAVGTDLIPPVDNIKTFEIDNFTMTVKASYFDSLWTNNEGFPLMTIGRITNDAFYGKTAAGAYMQFVPPVTNFTFPTGFVIDSTVLSIPYSNFVYGDTDRTNLNHAMYLKAYQITDDFKRGDGSKKYYSFSQIAYNPTPIGSGTITVKSLTDTVVVLTDTVSNLLRLKLDPSVNAIFTNMTAAQGASADAFQDYFRGIFLGPDTNVLAQNTLGYFALAGGGIYASYTNAQLEVYYHTATDPKAQRSFFRFSLGTSSFFNGIYKNYNGAPAQNYLNNQTADRDSILVQGYPGFRSDLTIKIDNNNLPPSVINKAALIITVLKTGDDDRFNATPQLIVRALNDDGTERAVTDMIGVTGAVDETYAAFVDGRATTVDISGTKYIQYTLNIPRELQKALSEGKSEVKLRLLSSTSFPAAFRMVANGPNGAAATKLRFNVIYTKID